MSIKQPKGRATACPDKPTKIMTRQQKIEHLERKGYKVKIIYSGATHGKVCLVSPRGNETIKDSVNQAHALIFGY